MASPAEIAGSASGPRVWHAASVPDVAVAVSTDPDRGLTPAEAAARLRRIGPNELVARRREPWWAEAVEALTEPLVLLLIGVGLLYGVLGELRDAITILFVIVAVAAVEVANEGRAKRAIAALRDLSSPTATLLRNGRAVEVPAAELVPGDLVLLHSGDRVPADLRLVESAALRIDESSLTGESVPSAKEAGRVLPGETELGDRRNMAYAGTVVAAGKGRGVAVATGRSTELGRVAGLAESTREPRTPLQQQMRELSGWLLWLALGFSLLVPLLGVLVARQPLQQMLLTGLSLAFATIPEELPILIAIVLGIGAYRLSQEKAIVKRLRAAETLGSVSAIGTDKTGTLTENRMQVARVLAQDARRLLTLGVLANDAQLSTQEDGAGFLGDPMEVALLEAARREGVSPWEVRRRVAVLEEHPFDDRRRRMSVLFQRDGTRWVAVKGAPEAVLAACSSELVGAALPLEELRRRDLLVAAKGMAAEGLRVLAFAERRLDSDDAGDSGSVLGPGSAVLMSVEQAESQLTFVGLVGLEDPPRAEVPGAVATLQAAGVRVLMLTGDHPATARTIARQVGIPTEPVVVGREMEQLSEGELRDAVGRVSIFARITPEHKLRVVQALAARGEVVAVTGDGVNDAPALREAAIGVAMGQTGTDVAREAADLVLMDDDFATVTSAVREGRKLYENLHKAIRYYLAAKVALIAGSLVAVLAQLPVPFAPVQIIVMELFMDLGASTTFVAERPEGDVMARPPRDPKQPFMDGAMQFGIFAGGLSLAAAVVAAYLWTLSQGLGLVEAQTAAFATWMIGHLALAAHMRSERQPLLRLGLLSNGPYLLWAAGALALLALGIAVPFFQGILHLAPLTASTWAVCLAAGLLAPSWWEVVKTARWRGRSHS